MLSTFLDELSMFRKALSPQRSVTQAPQHQRIGKLQKLDKVHCHAPLLTLNGHFTMNKSHKLRLALALTSACMAFSANAQDLVKSYEFTWKVANVDGIRVDIVKTEESMKLNLHGGGSTSFVSMPVDSAAAIAPILAKAGSVRDELKPGDSRTVEAKPYRVHFIKSQDGSFRGMLGLPMSMQDVSMTVAQAQGIAELLAKAPQLAASLNTGLKVP